MKNKTNSFFYINIIRIREVEYSIDWFETYNKSLSVNKPYSIDS
jgi:hypothetical protein